MIEYETLIARLSEPGMNPSAVLMEAFRERYGSGVLRVGSPEHDRWMRFLGACREKDWRAAAAVIYPEDDPLV